MEISCENELKSQNSNEIWNAQLNRENEMCKWIKTKAKWDNDE